MPPATLTASQVTTLLHQISFSTGAEVVFKSMCFEMHGLENEVRAAVSMVSELDIIKVGLISLHCRCRYQPSRSGIPSRNSLPDRTLKRTP